MDVHEDDEEDRLAREGLQRLLETAEPEQRRQLALTLAAQALELDGDPTRRTLGLVMSLSASTAASVAVIELEIAALRDQVEVATDRGVASVAESVDALAERVARLEAAAGA